MSLIKFIKVAVLAFLLLFPTPTNAEIKIVGTHNLSQFEREDLEKVLRIALEWVAKNSSYTHSEEIPTVEFVSPKELDVNCEEVCPVARFSWYDNHLQLSTELDVLHNPRHEAAVVHEIVHYLQMRSGKVFRDNPWECMEDMALEEEAYRLQRKYYREHGGRFMPTQIPDVYCNMIGQMKSVWTR